MRRLQKTLAIVMVFALTSLGLGTAPAQAQRRAYRLTDRQVEQIIRRVENRADTFRRSLDAALDNSRIDGTRREDNINMFVADFETATNELRSRFNARRSVAADVELVLDRAARIDNFLRRNALNTRAQNDWSLLRTDLNALASAYGVSANWNQTGSFPPVGNSQNAYRLSDREVMAIIQRVETSTNTFQTSLDRALDRSRIDGTRSEDNINEFVRNFESATDQLRARFDNRSSVAADVETVLDRAAYINDFMRRNRLTRRAENDWTTVRSNLNALASAYTVAWNWDNRTLPGTGGTSGTNDARLTGTYRLDVSRSDDPRTAVERATNPLPTFERQRVYDALLRRLEAPDQLAIERRGLNVAIASTRAPQTSFVADGRERSEQAANGRTIRVSSRLNGDQLVVTSTGFRESDFTVTFDPIDNGRSLRVTRRIYSDRLTQPVVVQNVYERTADVARFDIYNGSSNLPDTATNGDFVVRNGQVLLATLNTNLSTKTSQDGDRFTMTVREPAEYEGAVIEGTVSNVNRSGRVTGRSEMNLNFDTIRLRNGQSYRFSGLVDTVRSTSGETVRVDNEGSVRDENQTDRTVQRTAIGTAVGAVIGAIAGGGKGAAIGAVIGAGAGAGSVYVQGRDDLELLTGSEVTIRASSPNNR